MKNKILYLSIVFLVCIFVSCKTNITVQHNHRENYFIYKIDSINNFYLIYAKQNNSHYKIVSQKRLDDCDGRKIRKNKLYKLSLESIWNMEILIDGINVSPSMTPSVQCLAFDEDTTICLERDSINDLFTCKNLVGLCYSK